MFSWLMFVRAWTVENRESGRFVLRSSPPKVLVCASTTDEDNDDHHHPPVPSKNTERDKIRGSESLVTQI